jgi:hypothetical protein
MLTYQVEFVSQCRRVVIIIGGKMKVSLSTFWDRLVSSSLCELVELFGDKVPSPDLAKLAPYSRDRVFNQWRAFWLFLGQVLSGSQSCREALRKAQAWLLITARGKKKHLI